MRLPTSLELATLDLGSSVSHSTAAPLTVRRPASGLGTYEQSSIIALKSGVELQSVKKWRTQIMVTSRSTRFDRRARSGRITDQLSVVLAQKTCPSAWRRPLYPSADSRAIHKRHGPVALVQFDAHNEPGADIRQSHSQEHQSAARSKRVFCRSGCCRRGLRASLLPRLLQLRPRAWFHGLLRRKSPLRAPHRSRAS